MVNRYAQAYRRVYFESAAPTRILDETYARLLRDCEDAGRCIKAGDIEGKAFAINHAIDLVCALLAALDRETAPELATNLVRLYDFVRSRLLDASIRLDPAPLAEASQIVTTLRDAFAKAAEAISR